MADDDLLDDPGRLRARAGARSRSSRRRRAARWPSASRPRASSGDLKENAEYHDAKDAQAILETTHPAAARQIARAQVVEAEAGGDAVAFGSEVMIADRASGKQPTYMLVSAVDADAAEGRLSVESPVARALVGCRAGDVIEIPTPKGTRTLEVISIA